MLPTQSWDCPRELRLAEQVALQHFRNHAPRAVVETVQPVQAGSRIKRSSFAPLPTAVLQEEHVLLEASVARIRPQRAPRGAKKLQSSFDDLLPDCGAAGTADVTAELIPDYAEAHMAPAHPPVVRRSTHQTSEPGENSDASSLLPHAVHIAPDGCDVFHRRSFPTMAPGRPNTIQEACMPRRSTPTWPVASGASPKLSRVASGKGLHSPPLSRRGDLHNVTLEMTED